MWPEQAPPAPDSRSSDPLDRSELRVSELIATKIASRLVLEGAGYGRYDSGDSLPESPVIHTTVRLVASGRSFGTLLCSQEPWSRSPPGCSHPADASGREVRPGSPASDHRLRSPLPHHTGKGRDSSANRVIPSSQDLVVRLGCSADGPREMSSRDARSLRGGELESDRRLSVELARRGSCHLQSCLR